LFNSLLYSPPHDGLVMLWCAFALLQSFDFLRMFSGTFLESKQHHKTTQQWQPK
jgi:hypothetical protein